MKHTCKWWNSHSLYVSMMVWLY